MTPDDPTIPDNDVIANRARHALHQLAGARRMDSSWVEVQKAARRVQQQRLSILGAACAIVLVGGTAAFAAIGDGDGPRVNSIGQSTVTSTSATTAPAPLVVGSSSSAPTLPDGGPGAEPGTAPTAGPTAPTEPAVLQPQEGSWSSTTSVDNAVVSVGGDFVVSVDLTNTGTQPQATSGYFSFGIVCSADPETEFREGLPIGQFFTEAPVMQPGETHSFSATFHAEPEFVGSLQCGAGMASHGDAFAAGPGPNPVAVEIVPGPNGSTTTSTTDTVPTTETTVP